MLISDVATILRIKAREAPLFMLERLVRESARTFFRESRAWRIDFAGALAAGSDAYALTLPTGAIAHDIIYAKLSTSNTILKYLRDASKAYMLPFDQVAQSNTVPHYITLINNNTFQLVPPPAVDDVVDLRIILTLDRTAVNIEDAIVEEFEDVILDGALARLYEMPNESWSDIKLSQYHLGKFLQGSSMAKLRAEESRTPGTRVASFSW